jgi:hypothetical protein
MLNIFLNDEVSDTTGADSSNVGLLPDHHSHFKELFYN